MKPTHVIAIAGLFAGQTGRVITSHTYREIGLHYSVRFPAGHLWISAAEVRPATPAEITAGTSRQLRPAA